MLARKVLSVTALSRYCSGTVPKSDLYRIWLRYRNQGTDLLPKIIHLKLLELRSLIQPTRVRLLSVVDTPITCTISCACPYCNTYPSYQSTIYIESENKIS